MLHYDDIRHCELICNFRSKDSSDSTHRKEIPAGAQNVGMCFKAVVRGYSAEEFLKNGCCYVGSN
mgnify:CR=1 FL=1